MERSQPTLERRRPTTRRPRPSWRIVLGLLAALCGLVLPWVGLTLSPSLSAWHLTFALGAMPLVGHLTYGEVLAALVIVAHGLGRPLRREADEHHSNLRVGPRGTRLIFVVTTRVMGAEILFRLSTDTHRLDIVDRQILEYHFVPPTSFLGFTPDATTSLVLERPPDRVVLHRGRRGRAGRAAREPADVIAAPASPR